MKLLLSARATIRTEGKRSSVLCTEARILRGMSPQFGALSVIGDCAVEYGAAGFRQVESAERV